MVVFQFCGEQHFFSGRLNLFLIPSTVFSHMFGRLLSMCLKLFLFPIRNTFLDPLKHFFSYQAGCVGTWAIPSIPTISDNFNGENYDEPSNFRQLYHSENSTNSISSNPTSLMVKATFFLMITNSFCWENDIYC